MLVGMGMVFIFLSILVFITSMMERTFGMPSVNKPPKATIDSSPSEEEIAVISSAIHRYRQQNKK